MSNGIVDTVRKYTGKPVSLSYRSNNGDSGQEEFYKDFYKLFKQSMPSGTRELEVRIKKLPGFSIQELLLSSETATYHQAAFAIGDVLDKLITYSGSKYIKLRLVDRFLPEVAFKDSMNEIEELKEAVQTGQITEDFKFMVQRQLDEKIWSYHGERWER